MSVPLVHSPAFTAHGPGWSKLLESAAVEEVEAGQSLRKVGDVVVDLLVIDRGLVEVERPGESPRWGGPGVVLGAREALLTTPAAANVTAIRHGRVARIPVAAIRSESGGATALFPAVDQLEALDADALLDLPPDPLVIAAVLDGLDADFEEHVAELLQQAVSSLARPKLVRVKESGDPRFPALADELASHEEGAATVVYLIGARAGPRGAAVTAHADRVLLIQPVITNGAGSPARDVACDGSPRRHTEVVYVVSPGTSSDATQGMRVPKHTRRAHFLLELSVTRLELLLADLRQGARDHEALRLFDVFRELTSAELAWVQRTLRWERVDGGSILVRQGEAADALWLVRAGRLEAQRDTPAGPRHAAWLGPGQVVGETAVIAETVHGETVRAVRDSTVARMDRDAVAGLMARSLGFARVMAYIVARASATRALGDMAPRVRVGRTIAIIPLTTPERVARFATALAGHMERAGARTTVVDAARLDHELGASASRTRRGEVGDAEIIAWLARLEEQHDTLLLVCGAEADSWMRRAMRQGDKLLFVADSTASPALRPFERADATTSTAEYQPNAGAPTHEGERHLVLLQPAGITEAVGTMAWLNERTLQAHHHVRDDSTDDLARVARRLTGRAVALAFSAAATRAPAHFGVVRAMRELGLPIDILSGSSSGAAVASLIGMGLTFNEALEHALAIIGNFNPTLRQFQPPITALTSGKAASDAWHGVFGERRLEDQLVPVTITAVDIRRHRVVLLTRGPIWKLVRASGSLPLLWPPVWHEEDLLVDGAIVNYLPIDVFGDEAALGLTVGSNLEMSSNGGELAFEGSLRYGTHLNGWRVLFRRLLGKKDSPPRLAEILYHAMSIPSFQQQEAFRRVAPTQRIVIVSPPLGEFGLFGVDAKIGQRLERDAAEHARGVLASLGSASGVGRG